MATWKKVIVSGSAAELADLTVDSLTSGEVVIGGGSGSVLTTTPINGTGNILATTGATNVSMTGSFTGSFIGSLTGTASFATTAGNTVGTVTFGEGLSTGSFNGSSNVTVQVSGAVDLTDNVITKWDNTNSKFAVSSLTDNGTVVSGVSSIQLTGTSSILTGSFTGSFTGNGSGLTGISASSVANTLDAGTGITSFSFDGSTPGVVVAISGSAGLSSNTLTKWTGNAFANTNITDDGSLVTVSVNTLFQGDITVQGTASFQNTETLLVADRFVLFASGSNTTGDGGIVIQQGIQNIGELYGFDSGVTRWGFTSSFDSSTTSFTPDAFVAAVVDLNAAGQADVARYQQNGNIKIDTSGNIYIYS